jgi:hypothetical protein
MLKEKDKRKALRRQMRYTAWVAVEGEPLHGCVLADISDTGCRIDVDDSKPVPDSFMLLLALNGAAKRKCRVVWRKERQIGVTFERKLAAGDRTTLVPTPESIMEAATEPAEASIDALIGPAKAV